MKKWLTFILILLIVFITFCFFWQEHLFLNRPINYDKFSAYFTSVGALGAAYSLFLLSQQNTISHSAQQLALSAVTAEPIFLPFSSYVKVIEHQIRGTGDERFYFLDYNDVSTPAPLKQLEILNRGSGPAKNFETSWSYSNNVKSYREYFDHHKLDYYEGESASHNRFIQIKSGEIVKIDLVPFFLSMTAFELAQFVRSGNWIGSIKPLFIHISWEDTMSNVISKVLETRIQVSLPRNDILIVSLSFEEFSSNILPAGTPS